MCCVSLFWLAVIYKIFARLAMASILIGLTFWFGLMSTAALRAFLALDDSIWHRSFIHNFVSWFAINAIHGTDFERGKDTLGCIWKINGMENDLMRIHWLDLRPCFSAVHHRKKKRVTSIHHQWLSLFVFRMCIQVSVVICLCDASLVLFQLVQFTRIPRTWRRVCFV